MKAESFEYVRPGTVGQALSLLASWRGDARLMAGGQTLGPMLNMRVATPKCIIDLSKIDALRKMEDRQDSIIVGAAVTHSRFEDAAASSPTWRLLSSVASSIAYRAIRNRGTIGGSLAHADPAADWPATMMLLGARLTIAGARRTRVVDMKDFMHGPFRTAIEPDEVLTSIEFRTISADARWGYYKVCRKGGEYPDAIGAVLFDRLRNIQRIIVGALDVAPQLLESLAMIVGQQNRAPESQMILDAIAGIAPDLSDVDLQLHAAAVRRAIVQAVS